MKYLIINADDFGYRRIYNSEILKLIKANMVSSTTVLVNRVTVDQEDQIKELIEGAKSCGISIGLHLEFSGTNFQEEISQQYEKFTEIFALSPSHIDLHKKTYLYQAFPFMEKLCKEKSLPCRNLGVKSTGIKMTSHPIIVGTGMTIDALKKAVSDFKDGGSYEILFHPGAYDPDSKSSLNKEREEDVQKIRGLWPVLKNSGIKVISYVDFAKL